jgi:hypothetical protein
MGFSADKIALKSLRKKIILENVGGMYNEKTKELLAVEEFRTLDMLNSPALVHELRHAIQDQYFHLAGLLGEYSDYDDRKLAALAAIEGDATLVMIRQLGFDPDLIGEAFSADNVLAFSALAGASSLTNAPAIVKYQLLMPYLEGLKFSREILLKQPPQSSEQILHPEKYFNREKPVVVSIGYSPAAGQLVHSGVIGEYFLNVLLANGADIGDAASGWGGDFYSIYLNANSYMLLWEAQWDTPGDCSRFLAAFRNFLEKNFKFSFLDGQNKGRPFMAGNSAAGYFFLYQINQLISGGNYD